MADKLGPEPQQSDGGKGDTTVAVDFDGPLHLYSRGWHDGTIYDVATPGALEACRTMRAAGLELVVFTARRELDDIRAWLAEKYPGVQFADVTNDKPIASLYIDDRAIRWQNWDQALSDVARYLEPHDIGTIDRRLVTPEELARFFHEQYEAFAPSFGWETQERSRVAWDDVPEENRRLMMAVAASVLMKYLPERTAIPFEPHENIRTVIEREGLAADG